MKHDDKVGEKVSEEEALFAQQSVMTLVCFPPGKAACRGFSCSRLQLQLPATFQGYMLIARAVHRYPQIGHPAASKMAGLLSFHILLLSDEIMKVHIEGLRDISGLWGYRGVSRRGLDT